MFNKITLALFLVATYLASDPDTVADVSGLIPNPLAGVETVATR